MTIEPLRHINVHSFHSYVHPVIRGSVGQGISNGLSPHNLLSESPTPASTTCSHKHKSRIQPEKPKKTHKICTVIDQALQTSCTHDKGLHGPCPNAARPFAPQVWSTVKLLLPLCCQKGTLAARDAAVAGVANAAALRF
jgi:hypothetical protein